MSRRRGYENEVECKWWQHDWDHVVDFNQDCEYCCHCGLYYESTLCKILRIIVDWVGKV